VRLSARPRYRRPFARGRRRYYGRRGCPAPVRRPRNNIQASVKALQSSTRPCRAFSGAVTVERAETARRSAPKIVAASASLAGGGTAGVGVGRSVFRKRENFNRRRQRRHRSGSLPTSTNTSVNATGAMSVDRGVDRDGCRRLFLAARLPAPRDWRYGRRWPWLRRGILNQCGQCRHQGLRQRRNDEDV